MERELWSVVYDGLRRVARAYDETGVKHPTWTVLAVLLWAALHDRPVSWAVQKRHWKRGCRRPATLPSATTVSRRRDSVAAGMLLRDLLEWLRAHDHAPLLARLDGKPLPVGGSTSDPEAKRGYAAGEMAKGYKRHTVWAGRATPEAFLVTPLSASEPKVAEELVTQVPALGRGGYLLADAAYDSSALHDAAATAGYVLRTPVPEAAGGGHRYQSPHRLAAIAAWQAPVVPRAEGRLNFAQELYRERTDIERQYGAGTSFGGGLGPLPGWTRRSRRVYGWVAAKLAVNGARILRNAQRQT